MSYNRRNNYGSRGGLQASFVSGGQFQPTKPGVQSQMHQPQTPLPPAPLKSALKKDVKTEVVTPDKQLNKQQAQQSNRSGAEENQEYMEECEAMEGEVANGDKKTFWRNIKTGKISKKEKRGRRNQRLRKILQPKNALMVLNELVGGQKFNIVEKSSDPAAGEGGGTFLANVVIDGQEFVGHGKNKTAAKSNTAEIALKQIIINKLRPANKGASTGSSVDGDGDVAMTEADESKSSEEDDVSWLHIASYAIHKLFNSWDADGALVEQLQAEFKAPSPSKPVSKKPAKQLPEHAELMNPVMLLNQMRPGTTYEDVAKEGNPPAIIFTVKTTCDEEEFFGKGNNKKVARKNCAYAACSKMYDIKYPAEEIALVANSIN